MPRASLDRCTCIVALDSLLTRASEVPVFIGNVPRMFFLGAQPCREKIDSALEQATQNFPRVKIISLSEAYNELVSKGYLTIGPRRVPTLWPIFCPTAFT